MYRFLARPIWLLFAVIVAIATYTFVSLGFWQLNRLEERRFDNLIAEQRAAQDPLAITSVLSIDDPIEIAGEDHAFRTVTMTGHFDPTYEVLARSQTYDGTAGFHVITPFVDDDGNALLVNQGWIPLEDDTPPFTQSDGETETITVTLQPSQPRRGYGPTEPDGVLKRIARIDIARLQEQIPYALYPVYGIAYGDPDPSRLPVSIPFPIFDEGSHKSYAIQWFTFAAISVGGFWALARTTARKRRSASMPSSVGA